MVSDLPCGAGYIGDNRQSIGKAEGSSRGSIKINYVLNGKVKKTRRGTRIKSMVYKAKVKVK